MSRAPVPSAPVPVELLSAPPGPPAAWQPGAGEPRAARPHRPLLSPRMTYLMQKVLAPNPVNRALGAVIERWPLARGLFTAVERRSKERLFGCRMCAQCALPVTGYSCPMGCPKELRNGPCGGVGPGGACEVYPERRCVWVVGYERAAAEGRHGDLRRMQRPVDHRRFGESSWLNYWAGRDEHLWTGSETLAAAARGDRPALGAGNTPAPGNTG